jgi:hypothetical protein
MQVEHKKKTFTDSEGREWLVRITNRSVRDIRDKLGLDIRELINDNCEPLLKFLSDSVRMSEVLYIICGDQAKERGVSEDSFLDGFCGDVADQASQIFSEAYCDFFPNPQLRAALAQIVGVTTEIRDRSATAAQAMIAEAVESTDIDSIVKSIVRQELSGSTQSNSA